MYKTSKKISVEVIENENGVYDSADITGAPVRVRDEILERLSDKEPTTIRMAHSDVVFVLDKYDINDVSLSHRRYRA